MRITLVLSQLFISSSYRRGSLEKFLSDETGVEEDAVLAYLPDGRRLRSENVRDLAGSEDQVCGSCLGQIDRSLNYAVDYLRVQQGVLGLGHRFRVTQIASGSPFATPS